MMLRTMEKNRRKQKNQPKERKQEEQALIRQAKELLMERNHMSEPESYRYIQKCSMDSGTNMVEMAQMIMSLNNL